MPSTVSLVPSPTGQKQFVLDQSSSTKKFNTLGRCYPGENTANGLWTRFKVSLLPATQRKVTPNRITVAKTQQWKW